MNVENRLSLKRISLTTLCIYGISIATLFFYITDKETFDYKKQLLNLILMWVLIVTPQLILFCYISNFQVRWIQLTFIILQIIFFIFSLYHHGKVLIFMVTEEQPTEMLIYIPIWQCVIFLALGLIFKLIKSY